MIHPFLKDRRSTLLYIITWILLSGIHFVILYGLFDLGFTIALTDALVFNMLMALIGLALWFPVRYVNTEKSPNYLIFISHAMAGSLSVFLWIALGQAFLNSLIRDENYRQMLDNTQTARILVGAFSYLVIILIYYLIVYYKNLKEKAAKEIRLENLVTESELNHLRSQINPHFLFNSLNSINSLTLTDSEGARKMIVKLSDFLRYSVDQENRAVPSLEEELSNIERYLHIEKVRFGEKLIFEKDVQPASLKERLPGFVLQPLFENAIKHGVYESTDPVVIKFEARSFNRQLVIKVSNTYDPDSIRTSRRGVGLINIHSRLKLIYKREDLMRVIKDGDRFEVELILPQEKDS